MPIDHNKPNIVQWLLSHGTDAEVMKNIRAHALNLALAESHDDAAIQALQKA